MITTQQSRGERSKAHALRREQPTGTRSSLAMKKLPARNRSPDYFIGRQHTINDHGRPDPDPDHTVTARVTGCNIVLMHDRPPSAGAVFRVILYGCVRDILPHWKDTVPGNENAHQHSLRRLVLDPRHHMLSRLQTAGAPVRSLLGRNGSVFISPSRQTIQ
jgi:hypothetical protein